jgi:hypothetical protein
MVARITALEQTGRPRFTPIDPSELRFLGKIEDGEPVCEDGVRGRVGHLRRGLRRAPPDLLGQSRHVWDEASYETVAWCGPGSSRQNLQRFRSFYTAFPPETIRSTPSSVSSEGDPAAGSIQTLSEKSTLRRAAATAMAAWKKAARRRNVLLSVSAHRRQTA